MGMRKSKRIFCVFFFININGNDVIIARVDVCLDVCRFAAESQMQFHPNGITQDFDQLILKSDRGPSV